MKEVSLLTTLLDKAVRQQSMYGKDHPISISSLGEFFRHLNPYLEQEKILTFTIKRTAILWNNEVAFELDKKDNNYVQEMYIDGVRSLTFNQGIQPDEIKALVSALSRDLKQYENREDDTVTLFWKCGFSHIRYETVDVYAGDMNALLRESFATHLDREPSDQQDFLTGFIRQLMDAREMPGTQDMGGAHEHRLTGEFEKELATAIPLLRFNEAKAARDQVQKAMELNARRDIYAELRSVFAEVMEVKASDPYFSLLPQAYLPLVSEAISMGNIRNACGWLKELRETQPICAQTNPAAGEQIEEEISKAFPAAFFDGLGSKWSASLPGAPSEWITLLELLGKPGMEAVLALAKHVTQETLHTAFVDFILSHPPADISVILEKLKSSSSQLVQDAVKILSHYSSDPRVISNLRPLAIHPSAAVRLEVVRAMRANSGPVRDDILIRAIGDSTPLVRGGCMQLLVADKNPIFAKPLAAAAAKDAFAARDPLEKRITLIALARCGGTAALGFLRQIAEDRGTDSNLHELRIAALHAIAEVPGPQSDAILQAIGSRLFENKEIKEKIRQLRMRKVDDAEELTLE